MGTGRELSLARIADHLKTHWLGRKIEANELWPTIDSTNNRAKELARLGSPSGTIVIATEQTAGRGRSGNVWHSPANSGLYISYLLRLQLDVSSLPMITLATGVAVAQAIQSYLGTKVGLKWVNDLIIHGKKIGGILAEYQGGSDDALILGIGLNLHKPDDLPVELKDKIGFLESYMRIDQIAIDKNMLVAEISNELEKIIEQIQSRETESLLNRWRAHSITLGEEISAIVNGEEVAGQALDIDAKGSLIIKTKSGPIVLPAGEVSIRKKDGSYI